MIWRGKEGSKLCVSWGLLPVEVPHSLPDTNPQIWMISKKHLKHIMTKKRLYNFPWHDINTSQITNQVLKKLMIRSGWTRLHYNLPRLTLAKWVPNAHAAVHVQNIRFLLGNKAWNAWQCAGCEIKVNSLCLLMPSQRDTDICSRMEWTRFTKHCKYKQRQSYSTPLSEARKCKHW